MKTFKVKSNGKVYNVKANDAEHAAKLVKMVAKDKIIRYKGAKIEKVNSSSTPYMIIGFGETYSSIDEAKRAVDEWIDQGIHFRDAAYDRSTIEALISDEKAAIDAYNVAIANLDGKIGDLGIKVLQNIRNDEETHVENLMSILTGNITEKNLTDSKVKDVERKDFNDVRVIERSGQVSISWASLGAVSIAEAENFMRDLQKAINYAKTQR